MESISSRDSEEFLVSENEEWAVNPNQVIIEGERMEKENHTSLKIPRMNSTLKLQKKLNDLHQMQFDESQVQISEEDMKKINAAAAFKTVNYGRHEMKYDTQMMKTVPIEISREDFLKANRPIIKKQLDPKWLEEMKWKPDASYLKPKDLEEPILLLSPPIPPNKKKELSPPPEALELDLIYRYIKYRTDFMKKYPNA